jgi:Holliday junction DNA helicase RuvB
MSESRDIPDGGPPTLNHVIGQPRAVQQIRTAIEAVINDRAATPAGGTSPALPHVLLVGPAGVGKSTLAGIIARELGGGCHEELAQNILSPASVQGLMMLADSFDVVFVDEIHELHPLAQTTLYRCLEERRLFLPSGPRSERQTIMLPPFTFVGATTDEWRLSKPLRDRFKIVIRLEHYSEAELTQLLAQRAARLGWSVEDAAVREIAAKGRGTPRMAIRHLEAARRVSRAEAADAVTIEHVRRMCEIEGVDPMGLDPLEQRYLRLLAASATPVRLNVLATTLGLPRRTIESVIEAELLRLGLIAKDSDGRMLTAQGREHLNRAASLTC